MLAPLSVSLFRLEHFWNTAIAGEWSCLWMLLYHLRSDSRREAAPDTGPAAVASLRAQQCSRSGSGSLWCWQKAPLRLGTCSSLPSLSPLVQSKWHFCGCSEIVNPGQGPSGAGEGCLTSSERVDHRCTVAKKRGASSCWQVGQVSASVTD